MQPLTMSNASEAYRRQGILTASPMELILLLFGGLKKDLLQAKMAINSGKNEIAHKKLINAQDIVTELINSLDFNIPLSNELFALYDFMLKHLEEINVKKDAALIPPLLDIVDTLNSTWQEVSDSQKGSLYLKEE